MVLALTVDPLSLIFGHPGPTLLTFARMEVGIEHGQIGTVLIEDLVGLYIRMIDGNLLILLKRDAIQAISQSEHALNHLRQFEVRAQHFGIDVIALQFEFVGIEAEIPRL